MATRCEMVIGFLIPHRCENPALGNCSKCGRGFCEEHMEITPQGMHCLACQQGLPEPIIVPHFAQSYTQDDISDFGKASLFEDDDSSDMFSDLS